MDDILKLKDRLDSHHMLEMITAMPSHLEEGLTIGQETDLLGLEQLTFDNIVLAGMGGSAIGGDIVRSCLASEMQIPFYINRDYSLPKFVGKKSLVICSSYSGNTDETISSFYEALERGARILVISTGGQLAALASSNGCPIIRIKQGLPPRAALGYSVAPLLIVLFRLGLCMAYDSEIALTSASMKRWALRYNPANDVNLSLDIARKIFRKIPIIYSGAERLGSVALRMKGQICENAKMMAFVNQFPELNHNELVGWQKPQVDFSNIIFIFLKDIGDHKRIKAGSDIVAKFLLEKGASIIELESEGETVLERMFSLIQLADFISYYLALLNNVDPFPVTPIDYLKENLKR